MGIRWHYILGFVVAVLLLAVLMLPRDREYGVQLNRSHRPREAKKFILPELKKNPNDRTLVFEAARMHNQAGDNLLAGKTLETYFANHQNEVEAKAKALAYYLQGHYLARAAALLEKYKPSGSDDQARLLSLYEQQGRLDKAIAALEAQTRQNPPDAEKLLKLSTLYAWSGKPLAAAMTRERAVRAKPEKFSAKTWLDLLDTYQWLGRPRLAMRAADELQARGNLSLQAAREVQTLRIRMRDLPGALQAARMSIRSKHATMRDWLDCVQLETWAGQDQRALATLQRAITRFPKNLELLRQAADQATRLKQPLLAAGFQKQVAGITRKEADWRAVAELLILAKQPGQALEALARFKSSTTLQPQTRILMIELALQAKDMNFARAQVDLLYAHPPAGEELKLQLADFLDQVGRNQERTMLLEQLYGRNPSLFAAGLQLADIYSRTGQLRRAEKLLLDLTKRIKHGPAVARVWQDLAQTRLDIFWSIPDEKLRQKFARLAIRSIETTLRHGDDKRMRVSLAWLLTMTGQPEKAEKALADPRLIKADLLMAMVEAYRKKSRPQPGLRLLIRYLELNRKNPDALYTLGDLKAELGLDPRLEFFRYLLVVPAPKTAEDWTRRARILWLQGKRLYALQSMRRAAAMEPDNLALNLDLADMLVRADLDHEARAVLKKLTRQASTLVRARALKLLATVLTRLGGYAQARKILRDLVMSQPRHAEAVADLAFVEDVLDNHRTAMRLYARALDLGGGGQ